MSIEIRPIEDAFMVSFDDFLPMALDDILEWLEDYGFLNEDGLEFRHRFWKKYVKEEKDARR